MAQTAGYRTPRFLPFKQALELGGNVRKGEHGTKVYFVKQHQVRDKGSDDNSAMRLVPMMREYTVFNVDQLLSYLKYYNEVRTHLSLEKDAPVSRAVERAGSILCRPVLGGLHHQYVRI